MAAKATVHCNLSSQPTNFQALQAEACAALFVPVFSLVLHMRLSAFAFRFVATVTSRGASSRTIVSHSPAQNKRGSAAHHTRTPHELRAYTIFRSLVLENKLEANGKKIKTESLRARCASLKLCNAKQDYASGSDSHARINYCKSRTVHSTLQLFRLFDRTEVRDNSQNAKCCCLT